MTDIELVLYSKIKNIMLKWAADDIYAVSFLVESNAALKYAGNSNVPEMSVSYNTLTDIKKAEGSAEEIEEAKWNIAFWRHEAEPVIGYGEYECAETELLFDWFSEQGIENVGGESLASSANYDKSVSKLLENLFDKEFIRERSGEDFSQILQDGWEVFQNAINNDPELKAIIVNEDTLCTSENEPLCYDLPEGHKALLEITAKVAFKLRQDGSIREMFGADIPILVHGYEYSSYDLAATKMANPNGEAEDFLRFWNDI